MNFANCVAQINAAARAERGRDLSDDEMIELVTLVHRELKRQKAGKVAPDVPGAALSPAVDGEASTIRVTARDADGKATEFAVTKPGGEKLKATVAGRDSKGRAKLVKAAREKLNPTISGLPRGMSDEAWTQLANRVTAQILREKQLKRQRLALQVIRRNENSRAIESHPDGPARGVLSLLIKDKYDRGSTLSVENRAEATLKDASRQLTDIIERTAPDWLGRERDPAFSKLLVREIFGDSTGDATAKAGAKAWKDVANSLRERMNLAGGKIGFLEDWAIPQSHNPELVRLRGRDEWVAETLPLLNLERYENIDGSPMSIAQVKEMLYAAHETISTGGLNQVEAGAFTAEGVLANRYADHRMLHFKDADAWLNYHERYGEQTVLGIMKSRIESMSRDIALVEVLGPNPRQEFQYWHDTLKKDGVKGTGLHFLETVFAGLTGDAHRVESQTLARNFQALRNIQVGKLGGALLSSVTDLASAMQTGHYNRLPFMQLAKNVIRSLNPASQADKALAHRAGLGLDTMLGEINRWVDEQMTGGWTSKAASAVLRASGLQAWTEAIRRGFSVTMMNNLGQLSRMPWNALEASDRARLQSYGFTADDWSLLMSVTPERWGGGNDTMLTPASIRALTDRRLGTTGAASIRLRNELVSKTLGMIFSEESYAVVTPGVRERAVMLEGLKRGTWSGEIARSVWLFKSFPVAVIAKHWMRGWGRPTAGGKAAYLASYLVASTFLGAIAVQLKDIAKGREPREMDEKEFWMAAFIQGGGASIFGDFVLNDTTRYGNSFVETAAGPVASTVQDVFNLTVGNIHEMKDGKRTDAGAEAIRFVQGNTPGMNLWYARAALDHLIFHHLQEYASPGYLSRMKRRVREETGQDFWWAPGQAFPGK